MKTKILMAALLSGLVMTAGAVQAQEQRERPDFSTLDLNGDGALTLEEMQARGEARFAEQDANGDGALSADELSARAADRAATLIERFDDNGDGLLQLDEMPTRDERRQARMFDRVDADEDGTISAEEFEAAQERMDERRDGRRGPGYPDAGKPDRGRGCRTRRDDALVEDRTRLAARRSTGQHMVIPCCGEPMHRPVAQTPWCVARSGGRAFGCGPQRGSPNANAGANDGPVRGFGAIARKASAGSIAAPS